MTKKDIEQIVRQVSDESEERTQRYLGILKEDFNDKLGAVLDIVKDIPEMKQKIGIIYEKVGETAVDVTIVKEAIKDHERRLAHVERA